MRLHMLAPMLPRRRLFPVRVSEVIRPLTDTALWACHACHHVRYVDGPNRTPYCAAEERYVTIARSSAGTCGPEGLSYRQQAEAQAYGTIAFVNELTGIRNILPIIHNSLVETCVNAVNNAPRNLIANCSFEMSHDTYQRLAREISTMSNLNGGSYDPQVMMIRGVPVNIVSNFVD